MVCESFGFRKWILPIWGEKALVYIGPGFGREAEWNSGSQDRFGWDDGTAIGKRAEQREKAAFWRQRDGWRRRPFFFSRGICFLLRDSNRPARCAWPNLDGASFAPMARKSGKGVRELERQRTKIYIKMLDFCRGRRLKEARHQAECDWNRRVL